MKKKRILKALRSARSRGCYCLTTNPRETCAACFASDILGESCPHPRHGFVEKVTELLETASFPDLIEREAAIREAHDEITKPDGERDQNYSVILSLRRLVSHVLPTTKGN